LIEVIMRSRFRTGLFVTFAIAIGGCVSQASVPSSGVCPQGLTYSCSSKVGKVQRCMCATREDLKQILDPVNEY
jgi:hypothetical protein